MGVKKPKLTEIQKLSVKALSETGLSDIKIAKQLKISDHTVKKVRQDPEILKKFDEIAIIKKELGNKFTRLANSAVDNSTSKMDEMNAYQSAIIAKIALESSRLIDGQTTQNVGVLGLFGLIKEGDADDD